MPSWTSCGCELTVVEVAELYGGQQPDSLWLATPLSVWRLEALADRSHRPRRCPHQMLAAVEAACASYAATILTGASGSGRR
jgi:hypothetical protein